MSESLIFPAPGGTLACLLQALRDEAAGGEMPPARRVRALGALWLWSGLAALALYLAVALPLVLWPAWGWPGLRRDPQFLTDFAGGPHPRAAMAMAHSVLALVALVFWLLLPATCGGRCRTSGARLSVYAGALAPVVLFWGLMPSQVGLAAASRPYWFAAVYAPVLCGALCGGLTGWWYPARRHPPRPQFDPLLGFSAGLLLVFLAAVHPGLAADAVAGFAAGFAVYFYRLPAALAYAWLGRTRPADFAANPYRADPLIRCPLPGVRRRLLALAPRQPEAARAFAAFLRARRPLQAGLAAELERAAGAGAR